MNVAGASEVNKSPIAYGCLHVPGPRPGAQRPRRPFAGVGLTHQGTTKLHPRSPPWWGTTVRSLVRPSSSLRSSAGVGRAVHPPIIREVGLGAGIQTSVRGLEVCDWCAAQMIIGTDMSHHFTNLEGFNTCMATSSSVRDWPSTAPALKLFLHAAGEYCRTTRICSIYSYACIKKTCR